MASYNHEERRPLLGSEDFVYTGYSYSSLDPPPLPLDPGIARKLRQPKRPVPIEPATVIFFLATLSTMPLCQQYLHARVASFYNYTDPNTASDSDAGCLPVANETAEDTDTSKSIQGIISMWSFLNTAADLLPSMVMSMYLGAYSDRAGRKVALVPPAIGGIIKSSIFFLVAALDLPLYTLLAGSLIDGMLGGPGAMLTGTYAYISDISTPKQRMVRFVIIDLCIGLGSALANVSMGFMIGTLGFVYPPLVLALLYCVVAVYMVFFVQETIEAPPGPGQVCECTDFTNTVKLFIRDNGNNRLWKLWMLALILVLFTVVDYGGQLLVTYFFLNPPLCWDSIYIGIYVAYCFIVRNGSTLGFIQLAQSKLSELVICILGIISEMAYFFFLAQATTAPIAFGAPFFGFVSGAPPSMLRSVGSKLVNSKEQGSMFAGLSLLQMLGTVVSNVIYNAFYTNTLDQAHGFVYFCSSFFLVIPLILVSGLYLTIRREAPPAVEFYVPARKYSGVAYESDEGPYDGCITLAESDSYSD